MRKAIFVLMLATWTLSLPAQEPDPDDRPDPELELELRLAQDEILPFEPLVYEVTVRNLSDKPQEVSTAFDRCWQELKIHLTDSAGKTSYLGTGLICCGFGGKITLPSKRWRGSVHHQDLFLPNPDNWLGTPGKYQLHATFSAVTGMKPLESKLVPLTIKPAKGDDKEVLKILRGKEHAKFLSYMFGEGKIAKDFERLIQKYPKSHYVPWCAYTLGRFSAQRKDLLFEARAEQAIKFYKLTLEKQPKFPLKTEVEYEIARELVRLSPDTEDEGIEKIEKLIRSHPQSQFFQRLNQTFNQLREKNRPIFYPHLPTSGNMEIDN